MENISKDMLLNIVKYLDIKDIQNLRVCKRFNDYIKIFLYEYHYYYFHKMPKHSVYYNNIQLCYSLKNSRFDLSYFPNITHLSLDKNFNQPINNFPNSLKYLKLGEKFDQTIILPENLEVLILGHYNQKLNFPKSLKVLHLGQNFNHPIDEFPNSLEELSLGYNFDQPINKLPNGLKFLDLVCYNLPLTLPEFLTFLNLGDYFNQKIAFPESLKTLVIGPNFEQDVALPKNLEKICNYSNYKIKFPKSIITLETDNKNFPKRLKELILGDSYIDKPINNLPDSLESLTLKDIFNSPINYLPESLKFLKFGNCFNQPVILPDSLETLIMGEDFDQPIILPRNLKFLTFGKFFNKPIVLNESLFKLHIKGRYNHQLNIPKSLKHLYIESYCKPFAVKYPINIYFASEEIYESDSEDDIL